MAFTERVKCLFILVSLTFNGYEFAELQLEQQQLTNNGDGFQGTENISKRSGENPDQPLDLTSIFGKNWEIENKPLQKDELESILKQVSKDAKEIESNTQGNLKPNDISSDILINTQNANKQFSENDIYQNTQAPWQYSQETSKENNFDSTFSAQTAFPFEVFNGQYTSDGEGGVKPVSSTYRPGPESITSTDSTASSFSRKPQFNLYAATTPSYLYVIQDNFNPTFTSVSVTNDVTPTEATIAASPYDVVSSTIPSLLTETRTEASSLTSVSATNDLNSTDASIAAGPYDVVSSTTPSFLTETRTEASTLTSVSVTNDVNPTEASLAAGPYDVVSSNTPSLLTETSTEANPDITSASPVNPTTSSWNPDNQSGISSTVPSEINPIRPIYRPELPMRPHFGGFGSRGYHHYGTQYWPSSYRIYEHRPHGYHYKRHYEDFNHPWRRCHNFHPKVYYNAPQWSHRQHNYGKNMDFRYGSEAKVYPYQNKWTRHNPSRISVHHNHRQRHYHRPGFQSQHGGTFITFR